MVSTTHTPLSGRFFFLVDSSPRFGFTPFSSPKVEPDSFKAASKAGLGFLKVWLSMQLALLLRDASLCHMDLRADVLLRISQLES